MKIKDILRNIQDLPLKAKLAHRMRQCDMMIKKAFSEYDRDRSFTPIQYTIKSNTDAQVFTISTIELQDIYGMKPEESLFFMDSLMKADKMDDKGTLIQLLQILTAGKHVRGPIITKEILSAVQKNQPEVWSHYLALCDAAKTDEQIAEKEMNNNLNEEL